MGEFTVDLNKFLKHVDKNTNEIVRVVVFELGNSLVDRTPVGNPKLWKSPPPKNYSGGRARANWQHGTHAKGGVVDAVDPSGNATKGKIKSSIPKKAAGKVHYIVNNLPYIRALENGHSTQAPRGMVGLAVAEFGSIVNTAARKVK